MVPVQLMIDLELERSWIAIGVFDGIHLAHQTLLYDMVKKVKTAHVETVALTFFPHPAVFLTGRDQPWSPPH